MSRAGDRLRGLAVRILDVRGMERIVEPLLADLEMEYADAVERGLAWRSRWILILGYAAFLKTIVLWQAEHIAASARAWTTDDRAALSRAITFSVAAGLIATLVLAVAPIRRVGFDVVHFGMFFFLVPQAIVLAVPIGFTLGVFLGLRGRTLSARSTTAVFACAIVCACACLAIFAWLVPWANQEFREAVFGRAAVKTATELTLGELSERLRSFERAGLADWDARVLAYTYHMRWALSCATLVLTLFALAVTRRMEGRWAVALGAVGACFSYYVLMWLGRAGAMQESFPAFVGAWLPNAVFALLWLALIAVPPREQDAQA